MGDSKGNIGIIVIVAFCFLVAACVLVWVNNKADSITNGFDESIKNNSSIHLCTDAEKQAEICTMEYAPVCGNDNKTYGNKCTACAADIESWVQGEC